eukprot:8460099-Alexandrium_andersonii.AAC.1
MGKLATPPRPTWGQPSVITKGPLAGCAAWASALVSTLLLGAPPSVPRGTLCDPPAPPPPCWLLSGSRRPLLR